MLFKGDNKSCVSMKTTFSFNIREITTFGVV